MLRQHLFGIFLGLGILEDKKLYLHDSEDEDDDDDDNDDDDDDDDKEYEDRQDNIKLGGIRGFGQTTDARITIVRGQTS